MKCTHSLNNAKAGGGFAKKFEFPERIIQDGMLLKILIFPIISYFISQVQTIEFEA